MAFLTTGANRLSWLMREPVKTFGARIGTFRDIGADAAARLIEAAADIALVLDDDGTIRDVYLGPDTTLEESREWLGQAWADTASGGSRDKVVAMLEAAATTGGSRRRQINHAFADGVEVPVMYTVVRLNSAGPSIAIGRDLRAVSTLQQRLIEVQQAMERDYWRMRHIETRYRLLFQLASEAVLVVDASNGKVIDANPAASRLLGVALKQLVGRAFAGALESAQRRELEQHLSAVRARGESDPIRVRVATGGAECTLSAAMVRGDSSPLFLIRLAPAGSEARPVEDAERARALDVLQRSPDGFVLTDLDGKILAANLAFLDAVELASEEQVRGESLGRWLGRPGADLNVLLSAVRGHGVLRLFSTRIQGEYGASSEVEVSAVAVGGATPCVGLTIRDVGRRLVSAPRGAEDLTRAVEQLTGLVGKVTLRDLVRDTTEVVERHFVEAALELAGGNRTLAAEVLGVSRQSLYVKLRRLELGDRGASGLTSG